MSRDPFRLTNQLDPAALDVIADRLETRGRHPCFTKALADYLDRMAIDDRTDVLDLGCGTGIVARAIAGRPGFRGTVLGIDRSPHLVQAAARLAAEAALGDRVRFVVGDAQQLDRPASSVDAVVAHTLFSHLEDPGRTLAEMRHVLRSGGTIGIFDGDYASLTFELADPERSRQMDEAVVGSLMTNPRILRQLPRLLRQAGFTLDAVLPSIVTEAGSADFWRGSIETYAKLAPHAGRVSAATTATWLAELLAISDRGEFFGSCVYYAYVAHKS